MSWTATPQTPTLDPDGSGNTLVDVVFSNGTTSKTLTFRGVDQAGLIVQARATIANLNHLDNMAAFVANPDLSVITIPNPASLTQDQIDLENFQKWLNLTIALAAAKDMGWITGTEPVVQNIKTKVLNLANTNLPLMFS